MDIFFAGGTSTLGDDLQDEMGRSLDSSGGVAADPYSPLLGSYQTWRQKEREQDAPIHF